VRELGCVFGRQEGEWVNKRSQTASSDNNKNVD
jgi:hypothetical protein